MCKYCEEKKDLIKFEEQIFNGFAGTSLETIVNIFIDVRGENNEYAYLRKVYDDDKNCLDHGEKTKIKFCPMCGRNLKNTILRDSDKAGIKYTDVQLEKPNMIEFGVMKGYKEYTIEEQISYIRKELVELENYTDLENVIEEAFDVAQSAFTLLKMLEHKEGVIIKVENKRHITKLDKRGYIE